MLLAGDRLLLLQWFECNKPAEIGFEYATRKQQGRAWRLPHNRALQKYLTIRYANNDITKRWLDNNYMNIND
jgi:hypothetical protein